MRANTPNVLIGALGALLFVSAFWLFYLSSGREHFGNAVLSALAGLASLPSALGILLAFARPRRPFWGWRVPAVLLQALAIAALVVVARYEL